MKKKSISRRDFLKGAALGVTAAGLAGCQPQTANNIANNNAVNAVEGGAETTGPSCR